ncbi:MAG: mechanosensitive ion channel family protein [Planctomycetota bacterium]
MPEQTTTTEPPAADTTAAAEPEVLSTEFIEQKWEAAHTLVDELIEFSVQYGFQIIGAIIILIIGWLLSRWIKNLVVKMLEKREIDITTRTFIGNAVKVFVLFVALIVALGNFGVSISPMIAALGALTFGATLALQGPISNYGAGLAIILTHPFRVGDTIEIQGIAGVIEDIKLGTTILSNADGEKITIPNSQVVGQVITNSQTTKVAETQIGIAYSDDPEKAIAIIKEVLNNTEGISDEFAIQVGIYEFGDSSVNIQARYWVPTRQYLGILHKVNLEVFKKLNEGGITIPFPQREIKML